MTRPARFFLPALLTTLLSTALILTSTARAGTTVDLAAGATRPATNDLIMAHIFAEASGPDNAEPARRVSALISEGLAKIRAVPGIRSRSGQTRSQPVYAKGGRIESWRVRSELTLEGKDAAAMASLLGQLQGSLGVAGISFLPAPETRKKAEDEALVEAIAAFRGRAKLVGETLGRPWKIKHLTIDSGTHLPPQPQLRAFAMAAEAAPLPLESGDSQINVNVSGQIELAD